MTEASAGPEPLLEAAETARAKVNLALHVVGRRADGYHLLESLAVFPEIGDRLSARRAEGLSLVLEGPFSAALQPEAPEVEVSSPVCYAPLLAAPDNLILQAAQALREAGFSPPEGELQGAVLRLEKDLPVASGIGGGSADAAAALRLLVRLWGLWASRADLERIALKLGADVPVCLGSRPALMRGIGEDLAPSALPSGALVLVNPGAPLATAAVFAALERRENPALPPIPKGLDAKTFAAWLEAFARNDLEAPARKLLPPIDEVLAALKAAGAPLARMSGSGATCFGLFPDLAAAEAAAAKIRAAAPKGWWIAAAAYEGRPEEG